jgi:hypothetical protein
MSVFRNFAEGATPGTGAARIIPARGIVSRVKIGGLVG